MELLNNNVTPINFSRKKGLQPSSDLWICLFSSEANTNCTLFPSEMFYAYTNTDTI